MYKRLIKQAEVGLSAGHTAILPTLESMRQSGGHHIQSSERQNSSWRKCVTNGMLQTKYVVCSQKPIEPLLNKKLQANSSMFTVAHTEEL